MGNEFLGGVPTVNRPTSPAWLWHPYDFRLPMYLLYGVLGILVLMELGCPTMAAHAQSPEVAERYTLTIGPISQTSTERDECYATIGFNPKEGFMIAAPPGAVVCLRLQELADRKVKGRLVFEVER